MTGRNRIAEEEQRAAEERARERQQREELQQREAGDTPRSV